MREITQLHSLTVDLQNAESSPFKPNKHRDENRKE